MDFDVQPSDSEDVQEKSYLTQLREALDVVNEKLLQNREKQRLLWVIGGKGHTFLPISFCLGFKIPFKILQSPNLNVCDKKPVFHQLKKFSREEVQHLKSGIAGLWALQKLSNGANTSSIHHEIKQENEMPWDEVAQILPDRTTTEVKLKWLNELDPRLLRNPWTTDELHKLESAVKKYNQREWIKVAKEVAYLKRTRNEKRAAQIRGLRTEKRQGGAKIAAEVIFNELTESDYGDSDDEYVPPEVSHSLRKKPRAPRKRPRSDSLLVKTEEEPNAKRFCKTPEKPSASEKAKESSSNIPTKRGSAFTHYSRSRRKC